jgi:thiamine pyrophosphate-dependent acetolactate synthase large subunit-like protein
MVGSTVDSYLRALPEVWVACDEFAAGCAAMAFHMVTGRVARVVAVDGPGTHMLLTALAIAAEEDIPMRLHTGADWTPPELLARPTMPVSSHGTPVRLIRFADQAGGALAAAGDEQIITEGSAIPGARLFGDRWLGYWGFMCDDRVLEAVATRPVISSIGRVAVPSPRTFDVSQAPLWIDAAVRETDAALPDDAPIVCDAGSSHESVARLIARRGLRPVLQTREQTTMGWSLGAALGVHVGLPATPLGVVIGDGSLLSRIGDLAVLVRYRVPAVILVIVNGLIGEGRRAWAGQPGADLAVLPSVDWAAVVNAVGATVAPDVGSAVSNADEGPQAVLVEGPPT